MNVNRWSRLSALSNIIIRGQNMCSITVRSAAHFSASELSPSDPPTPGPDAPSPSLRLVRLFRTNSTCPISSCTISGKGRATFCKPTPVLACSTSTRILQQTPRRTDWTELVGAKVSYVIVSSNGSAMGCTLHSPAGGGVGRKTNKIWWKFWTNGQHGKATLRIPFFHPHQKLPRSALHQALTRWFGVRSTVFAFALQDFLTPCCTARVTNALQSLSIP